MNRLLEVKDLHVNFNSKNQHIQAVRGISFHVNKGEVLAIVGESGCGKSVTAKSIMKLLPEKSCTIPKGSILFNGEEITTMKKKQLSKIRGAKIGMVFQDPMTSLNPTMKVGDQIAEGLIIHKGYNKKLAREKTIDIIKQVGIPNPVHCCTKYPHQLSGGMRQRIVIAMALICEPDLLIADEPTTALDVTIQSQILDLLKELQQKMGMAIILITHDLGVVARFSDRVNIMYAGKIVESGTKSEIFYNPKHPYTLGLLESIPKLDHSRDQKLTAIDGTPPDLAEPPKGCAFTPRCPFAMDVCDEYIPEKTVLSRTHHLNCWLMDPRAPKVATNKTVSQAANE
ncbi:MAG: ABC transporter ATP-binding protein [Bacillota bacterium]|uniref:Peptide ABC transporter ATP-binding protein n=1 Tax=Cytobacillus oceanisediminis 2691 TaxID=1196031 RepID=A0A169G2W4_9BACI|nr:ABC transporter ATP-binding protein [Cytobacillus oceanisediminis]AND42971.1 peptide ABC transporter ATP-binding protein [Cytobacillus oceanisediminis 2691]MCM3244654.1 ABC transporter ATP-binding protein [Cytobacillus oceanisediminis]USK47491.1 ABC transporter ATP-binding protein [Cytobacillus oceanisediminis]